MTVFAGALAASAPELKPCTLTYYYWNEPQKAIVDKTIEEFNKVYPDIKIESTVIPWAQYWTKLQTTLPSGAGPDLFQINAPHAVDYIPAGLALSLQDKIARDQVDMSVYAEGITKLYNFGGQQYAMPMDYDSIALFYNKAMFDAAGVAYPTDSWTWEDLLAAAQKLTIPGQQYGFAVDTYMQTGIGNFIFQNGGAVYSDDNTKSAINSPQNVETFQFLSDLMYVSKVSPTAPELVEMPTYMQFQAEKVAMITFGSWYVSALQETLGDKMGIAPLPQKTARASMLHGLGYAISANTQHPEEAWAFVKFCAQKEAMTDQASVVLPAYKGMEGNWVAQFPTLNAQIFPDAVAYGVPLPVAAKNSGMVEQVMYEALDKIWNQKATVADALKEAETNMNAEFAK
jgi:multiple sugar transport system substrate-binding protein